ncbi:heme-binding protein [Pseudarthrobacter sp. AG30]|uniref:SOUL family heme-binding protein n=1 Tax=Pseudarthrobacter sp. AG30 TaxID=2249742 RepID=UPI000D6DF755|nr:heme-binding protein [Pseudarthrobacter sp. AG30]RAX15258.1 heme-binding protein [Pseudarthrobacter sp. AG30]
MTEHQPYELIRRYPHFELRWYPAYVVAEVKVRADFDRAGNAAFRYLFNYISGNNSARRKLAMTAPVIQEPGSPQKLAMTAPVLQQGPLPGARGPAEFVVGFVLPAGVTADTAPAPADPRVTVRAVPASLSAALSFTGGGSASSFERHTAGLQAALKVAGLTPVGAPRYARFDPPFKPWFLRRNEVLQDIKEPG